MCNDDKSKEKKSIYKERKSVYKGKEKYLQEKEKYLQGFRCKTALQESTLATTSARPFPPSIIILFLSFLFFDHCLLS